LQALGEAIEEQGQPAAASNHIPAGAKVVIVETWRKQAYLRGISTGEDRARRMAFQRAAECLNGAGRIGIWGEQVWLV
jgi:hypothetical protein